jgi:hypothetical protein
VMDVLSRLIRVQNESFDVCWAEMEHPRLAVIDPNDGMIVMLAHAKSSLLAISGTWGPVNAHYLTKSLGSRCRMSLRPPCSQAD